MRGHGFQGQQLVSLPEINDHIGHLAMLVDGHAEIGEPILLILLEITVLASGITDIL